MQPPAPQGHSPDPEIPESASSSRRGPASRGRLGTPQFWSGLAVYFVGEGGARAARRLVGDLRLRVAPGERRVIPLDLEDFASRFASVSGTVMGRLDRRNELRLSIVSTEDPGEWFALAPAPPDPDGRFHFTGLPAGKYLILAKDGAGGPSPEARHEVQVKEGEKVEVRLNV